jgi:2'-5' RNA ligase
MFVAIWPDESTLKRLSTLDLGTTQGLRIVRPEHWHITLRFLGEVDETLTPTIVKSLRAAAETMTGPVHCEIGSTTAWFDGGRVLQLPVSGLEHLASAVFRGTTPIIPDTKQSGSRFTGHLTLARSRKRLLDPAEQKALTGISFRATSNVDYFDLVASRRTSKGPEYATVMRVPFPT